MLVKAVFHVCNTGLRRLAMTVMLLDGVQRSLHSTRTLERYGVHTNGNHALSSGNACRYVDMTRVGGTQQKSWLGVGSIIDTECGSVFRVGIQIEVHDLLRCARHDEHTRFLVGLNHSCKSVANSPCLGDDHGGWFSASSLRQRRIAA